MGLYKDYAGKVVDVADEYAARLGYEPYTSGEEAAKLKAEGQAQYAANNAENAAVVAGRAILSAGTLGATDVLSAGMMSDNARESAAAGMEAHPYARMAGEIVGSLATAFAAPGSLLARSPAGYLASKTAEAAGKGAGKLVVAAGVEGAFQNAGQYIGHAALEDKELSVEGLAGAAGIGFGFGAAGAGAVLGIEKGTIAARRMFSRVADGGEKAATDAFSAWETKSKELLDADQTTADVARKKLEAIRNARMAAEEADVAQAGVLRDERLRKGRVGADPKPAKPGKPTDTPMEFDGGDVSPIGMDAPTSRAGRQQVNPLDDSLPGTAPVAEATPVETAAVAEAAPVETAPFSITRDGRKYKTSDGRVLERNQLDAAAIEHLPEGFKLGGNVDPSNVTIQRGMPETAPGKNTVYVIKPSELTNAPGLFGNELKTGGVESIDEAFKAGKRLDPIEIDVAPNGKLFIEDGNHRLFAAAKNDREIVVRFREVGPDWKPQAGSRGISDKIGNAKPKPRSAFEEEVVPEFPFAEQQVAEMRRRMTAGEDVVGWQPNEKWAAFKKRRDAAPGGTLRKPTTLQGDISFDPRAPEDTGLSWVNKQQSVAGLKDVRNAFGKLTRGKEHFLSKEEKLLEEALVEFEDSRRVLMERIQKPEALEFTPVDRSMTDHMMMDGMPVPADFAPRGGNYGGGREQKSLVAGDLEKLRGQKTPTSNDATRVVKKGERVGVLESRLDDAKEMLANATDDLDRKIAQERIASLEKNLAAHKPDDVLSDIEGSVDAFNRYEKASAKLAEALGDQAHPVSGAAAKAFNEADDAATKRMLDRMARAAEDAETFGPAPMSTKDRVQYAKERKGETAGELGRMRGQEKRAAEEARLAKQKFSATKKEVNASKPEKFSAKASSGVTEGAGLYEMMDIPGMPKVGNLPGVGPLLSAYLKYRTVKAALGRFAGRVPATADSKAAALAARTRDKIATRVDHALGFAEKNVEKLQKPMVSVTAALSRKIYDKLERAQEDESKKPSIQELAARRVEEIAAYVTTPGAIEQDVRRELRDVTDPDLIAAAEKHRRMVMEHLLSKMPKQPEQDPLAPMKHLPSPMEALELGRRLEVANDPDAAFKHMVHGTLTLEAADTLRTAFPRLFQLGQERLLMRAGELKEPVPYARRVAMSMLFDVSLDKSLDPRNIRILQSVYKPSPGSLPGMGDPLAPPTPALAGDVNINALYQSQADRSSSRR